MKKKLSLEHILWGLYALVSGLSIYVWGEQLSWSFSNLNSYNIFPLFGLMAFSFMWVHYVSGYIRDKWFPGESTKKSFTITSYLVLALIILHPLLLIFQLNADGFGLPPESYKNFVGESNVIWVLLGTLGLAGLLSFELKHWFGKKNCWKYIGIVNDVAVLFIAAHSLQLGRHLQSGWFVYIWYFYIVTIVAAIARTYYKKLNKS
jgi:hypothetical protein